VAALILIGEESLSLHGVPTGTMNAPGFQQPCLVMCSWYSISKESLRLRAFSRRFLITVVRA
jgi:hypothetical protein